MQTKITPTVFMFSRLQTLFLLVVVLAMLAMFVFPIWEKYNKDQDQRATLTAYSLRHSKDKKDISNTPTFYIAILAGLAGAISLYSVFRYRNQDKNVKKALYNQMKLSLMNALVLMIVMGLTLYSTYQANKLFANPTQGIYSIGFFMPLLALVCNSLAGRFIRRDVKLISSMDRIR